SLKARRFFLGLGRSPRQFASLQPMVHDGDLLACHERRTVSCVGAVETELANGYPGAQRAPAQVWQGTEVRCEAGAQVRRLPEIDAFPVTEPGVDSGPCRDVFA